MTRFRTLVRLVLPGLGPKRHAAHGWLATLAVVAAAVSACGTGGDQVASPTTAGAAETADAGASEDCSGSGTAWSDLYRDVFGPTGSAGSCSFAASCHGTADGAGARSPGGLHCFDVHGCRASLFEAGLLTNADVAAPEKSRLLRVVLRVRAADGSVSGIMPQSPASYVFPSTCVERIATWIRQGAKDD